MTIKEAIREAIDVLESDAEATEHEQDAARWLQAASVLGDILRNQPAAEDL